MIRNVLRDNGIDIYARIKSHIAGELRNAETVSGRRKLTAARDSVQRYLELIRGCGSLKELEEPCDTTLKSIEGRLSIIAREDAEKKQKLIRYGILGGAASCCIALVVLVVCIVRGLPPSEKDIKTELSYKKVGGAYKLQNINSYYPVITTANPPAPSDKYTGLCVDAIAGDERFGISDSGDGWTLLYGDIDPSGLSYSCELDYAGARMTENYANVPVLIHISYMNMEGELNATAEYRYAGKRCWEAMDSSEPFLDLSAKDAASS